MLWTSAEQGKWQDCRYIQLILDVERYRILAHNIARHIAKIQLLHLTFQIKTISHKAFGVFSYHCWLTCYGRGSSHRQRVWCWTGITPGGHWWRQGTGLGLILYIVLYLVEHLKPLHFVLRPHHQWLLFGSDPVGSFGHSVDGVTEVHHMSIVLVSPSDIPPVSSWTKLRACETQDLMALKPCWHAWRMWLD